jgi:hypothetical protein
MDGERRRCRRKLAARRWSRQGGGRRRVATAGCCVSEEAQQELAAHLAAPLPSPAGRSGREAKQGKMGVETEGHDHHAGAADGEDKGGGDPHALSSLTHVGCISPVEPLFLLPSLLPNCWWRLIQVGCPGDRNIAIHVSCCTCCRFWSGGEEQRMGTWGAW